MEPSVFVGTRMKRPVDDGIVVDNEVKRQRNLHLMSTLASTVMVDEPAHYSQSIVQLLGMVVRATSHRPAVAELLRTE
jgi:hypothetical protein